MSVPSHLDAIICCKSGVRWAFRLAARPTLMALEQFQSRGSPLAIVYLSTFSQIFADEKDSNMVNRYNEFVIDHALKKLDHIE